VSGQVSACIEVWQQGCMSRREAAAAQSACCRARLGQAPDGKVLVAQLPALGLEVRQLARQPRRRRLQLRAARPGLLREARRRSARALWDQLRSSAGRAWGAGHGTAWLVHGEAGSDLECLRTHRQAVAGPASRGTHQSAIEQRARVRRLIQLLVDIQKGGFAELCPASGSS
jgi:hypothetical protein